MSNIPQLPLVVTSADLQPLASLSPFLTDGYRALASLQLPLLISYTSQTGKSTSDQQDITIEILARWMKGGKGKDQLQSVRMYIISEEDIFLGFVCNFSLSAFQALKLKNQLNLHFQDFPQTLIQILSNCGGSSPNCAEFHLSYQGTGKLKVVQKTQYKTLELLELFFTGTSIEKCHQSIIYRYNYGKSKLKMIQNSIDEVYKLLAVKNPPLLAYIQKTVGIDS